MFNLFFHSAKFISDDPESTLYGSFRDGIFDGHIIYGNGESYTVDKIDRYLHWKHRPKHFHSIIYSGRIYNLFFVENYGKHRAYARVSFCIVRITKPVLLFIFR